MAIKRELVDELLKDADPKKVFSSEGLMAELKKALAERMLNAEMDHHLSWEGGVRNGRNGYGQKTVLTDELEVPRDRQASFDPQLVDRRGRRTPLAG